MIPVIAFANSKGGSGKTTSVVSVAGSLSRKGYSVLVVDLSPSANASTWLGARSGMHGAFSVLYDGMPLAKVVAATAFEGIEVVRPGTRSFSPSRNGTSLALREELVHGEPRWDIVLLDTAPADDEILYLALENASRVVLCADASRISIDGLGNDVDDIRTAKHAGNVDLELLGILICRNQLTRHSGEVSVLLEHRYPGVPFKTVIRESVHVANSYNERTPVSLMNARSNAADDYDAATAELIKRLHASADARSSPTYEL